MWNNLPVVLDHLVYRVTWPGWEIKPRYITNYELVFLMQGQGEITIEDKHYAIRAGDCICFRPGVLHSLWVRDEPCMIFYGVHFTPPPEHSVLPIPAVMRTGISYRVEWMLRELLELYKSKPYLYSWKLNVQLQKILCEIFATAQSGSSPSEYAKIKSVLDQIHAHPTAVMTIEEMLCHSGMTKTAFSEAFRRVTGTTPRQYVIKLQLEYARDLLLNSNQSIAQIAEQSGFSDSFYFSRIFKQHFTVSPRQYRAEHQG